MGDIQKQLGVRIRHLREEKGISQEALAALCGLHRTYVGLIERGERNLSLTTVETIAEGLGVAISELFLDSKQAAPPRRRAAVANRPQLVSHMEVPALQAHALTTRKILIDAGLTDSRRYEALHKTFLKQVGSRNEGEPGP